ncbi:PD-(D/E)XK nuclease family protein [Aquihabitans daechungensis]|uniref:PDDEXK-like family protein n=1 Tax=Aquihabitans daechungensis TaxID=1052257 RepID=UPI003BA178E3
MGKGGVVVGSREAAFDRVEAAWRELNRVPASWQHAYSEASTECTRLAQSGRWLRGEADLLSIVGRQHQEAVHSAAIAWLLDPAGSHGLGAGFLERFLTAIGLHDIAATIASDSSGPPEALVTSEVNLVHDDAAGRIDIRVDVLGNVIIIENKVNAAEHGNQLHRYRTLADTHPDLIDTKRTTLVLLALAPRERILAEARREGFVAVTYRDGVRIPLAGTLSLGGDGPGRQAAFEYLKTIERMTT